MTIMTVNYLSVENQRTNDKTKKGKTIPLSDRWPKIIKFWISMQSDYVKPAVSRNGKKLKFCKISATLAGRPNKTRQDLERVSRSDVAKAFSLFLSETLVGGAPCRLLAAATRKIG